MFIARSFRSIRLLLLAIVMLAAPMASSGQVAVSITIAPPELPVYEQPVCPGDGYIWTPGYWAWDGDDYYWVPGTWVLAPEVGFLWTPGYWGWSGASFVFYQGYWGPRVGFYGGINYGYGYFGHGYEGGRWDHDRFYYNRSVNNVNVTVVHNVYNTTVVNRTVTRVSYNGGNGGINERPTKDEEGAARQKHIPPVTVQTQQAQTARNDRELRASVNHGKPPIAATSKPGEFNVHEAVPAKGGGADYNPPAHAENNGNNSARANTPPVHAKEVAPVTRPAAPNAGNTNLNKKYQQQQDKLNAKQAQDQAKLEQKQEKDHQRLEKQQADEAKKQQVEQKHQQQTQQMVQKHDQQQQKLQQKQQPAQAQHQNQSKPPKGKS